MGKSIARLLVSTNSLVSLLGLEAETQIISVSDSVLGWDSDNFSFGLGLDIETLLNPVSDSASKLRLIKFQSRTKSRN